MKVYGSIGHWKGKEYQTCVCMNTVNLKSFKENLKGNEFVSFMTLTEEMLDRLGEMTDLELWEQVKKSVGKSRYRQWEDVYEYICQCYDIMCKKFKKEGYHGKYYVDDCMVG